MKKNHRICVLGEPQELRHDLCAKLSRFYEIPSYGVEDLIHPKENISEDDSNELRFKLSLIGASDKGFVLDGLPLDQGDLCCLDDVDIAIFLKILADPPILQNALRRWCPTCFFTYHVNDYPSKEENKCDRCNQELRILPDDDPRIIRSRIDEWYSIHADVLNHFRKAKKLIETEDRQIDNIAKTVHRVLTGRVKRPKHLRRTRRTTFDVRP